MPNPTNILKAAVSDITHCINEDGLSPHDAVVKVAKVRGLNEKFIKRACEALNVALTYEHIRKNADAKETDFPIVEPSAVCQEVYSPKQASLGEKYAQVFAATKVDEVLPDYRKIIKNHTYREKYAELRSAQEPSRTMSLLGAAEKAAAVRADMMQTLDNCRVEYSAASEALSTKFAALVNHWSRDPMARSSFAEFETQVLSKYGKDASNYLDFVYKTAELKEPRGAYDPSYQMYDDAPELQLYADFLKAAEALPEKKSELAKVATTIAAVEVMCKKDYYQLMQATINKNAAQLAQLQKEDAERLETEKQAMVDFDLEDIHDPVLKKVAAQGQGLGTEAFTKLLGFPSQGAAPASPASSKMQGKEYTPVDAMRRKLLIQNLMVTDPVLKTHNPEAIVQAYEQFLRLAPGLAGEKAIVRSHLRQMVEGQALDAYAAGQLISTDHQLTD